MKILFFIDSLRPGGKERRLVELIKGLDMYYPEIEKVLVSLDDDIHYDDFYKLNIKYYALNRRKISKLKLINEFLKIVKSEHPDIIHSWLLVTSLYSIVAKILYGNKIINSQITDAPEIRYLNPVLLKFAFKFSNMLIANSKAGLVAWKAPIHKSYVIYNGLDFARFDNVGNDVDIRKTLNISTPFIIGMIANNTKYKDYATFFKVADKILQQRNDTSFIAVGGGDFSGYDDIVNKHKERIKILGRSNEVEKLVKIFDIGVLTTFTEGIPNVVLEYMSVGKPVIVAGGGGVKEIINNGVNGYLVESGDVESLVKHINTLLDDDDKRTIMGNNAYEYVRKYHSLKRMTDKFVEKYKELV